MSTQLQAIHENVVMIENGAQSDVALEMAPVAAQIDPVARSTIADAQETHHERETAPLRIHQISSDEDETEGKCAKVFGDLRCTLAIFLGLLVLCATLVVLNKNNQL